MILWFATKENVMTKDKQYHTISAIYRMLRKRRINDQVASELLQVRARLRLVSATALVEIWAPSLKKRWALEDIGLDQWGQPP